MNIINQKGIVFLAKLIIRLYKSLGEEDTLKTIENDYELFSGLLSPNHLEDTISNNKFETKEAVLDPLKIPDIVKKLKFTKLQTILLKTIINNNNKIALTEIEREFSKRGFDVSTGSVVGGSVAGISKKCSKHHIPMLVDAVKQNGDIYYSLNPNVADDIGNYLN